MTYIDSQRAHAAAWKSHTTTLSAGARRPAPYVTKAGTCHGPDFDFCLPAEHSEDNLLPEVRDVALRLFVELGIPWHAGIGQTPSNHLLSSQVQCVNALAQMVADPGRIVAAFGELLAIEEVLAIEPGRYLTFEYTGPTDFFNESPGRPRIRGAHCTSVDAAFKHRAADGVVELVLLEWKYTESYRPRTADPIKDEVRRQRYETAILDPTGPILSDVLLFEYLLDEPVYQLMRQQLLAHALERSGAEGADRVRVVHVSPVGNTAYQRSLARPQHRSLGGSVSTVWQKLLRTPNRFVSVDSAMFLGSDVTSPEYVLRYSDDIAWTLPALLRLTDGDLEDYLYRVVDYDGGVRASDEEVELYVNGIGTVLSFPFTLRELLALCPSVEAEANKRAAQLDEQDDLEEG